MSENDNVSSFENGTPLVCLSVIASLTGCFAGGGALLRSPLIGLALGIVIVLQNAFESELLQEEKPPRWGVVLGLGAFFGLLAAGATKYFLLRFPPPDFTIAGWPILLSTLLFVLLLPAAYRLRCLGGAWHRNNLLLVWLAACVADAIRFLPLCIASPDYLLTALGGAPANVAPLVFLWYLFLRIKDPAFAIGDEEEKEVIIDGEWVRKPQTPRQKILRLARLLAIMALLIASSALLIARTLGLEDSWRRALLWDTPELQQNCSGTIYTASLDSENNHNLLKLAANGSSETAQQAFFLGNDPGGDADFQKNLFALAGDLRISAGNLETGEAIIDQQMRYSRIAFDPSGEKLACVGYPAAGGETIEMLIFDTQNGQAGGKITPGFSAVDFCWNPDGSELIGQRGKKEEPMLCRLHIKRNVRYDIFPGSKPRINPQTGELFYLHDKKLWVTKWNDTKYDEGKLVAENLGNVKDYCLSPDGKFVLFAVAPRFQTANIDLVVLSLASPDQRHRLRAGVRAPWVVWLP